MSDLSSVRFWYCWINGYIVSYRTCELLWKMDRS